MAGRPPIPIASIGRRIPEAGRIRTGEKDKGRGFPKAIPTFRFTSAERENVEQVAAIYGGEVRPFSDPKSPDRFEVKTTATEIRVALPPDPLGGTPLYQLYGGGGPERRCDGVTCERWRKGPEGPEPYEVECICAGKGVLECDVTTHLSVFLPEIRLVGVWRLTTKSYNAAVELPGMVDAIRDLQDAGIVRGVLSLKPHQQVLAGETRKFLVPTLGVDASMDALAEGEGLVAAALPTQPETAALTSGGGAGGRTTADAVPSVGGSASTEPAPSRAPDPDDDVVDAEIVEAEGGDVDNREVRVAPGVGAEPSASTDLDDLMDLIKSTKGLGQSRALRTAREVAESMGAPLPEALSDLEPGPLLDAVYRTLDPDDDGGPPSGGGTPAPVPAEDAGGDGGTARAPASQEATQQALVARIAAFWPGGGRADQDERRHAIVAYATDGWTTSSKECDKDQLLGCHRVLDEIESGVLVVGLFAEGGGYLVLPREEAA